MILCNHHFILLKLFWTIKCFILYQINQTALKSGCNFTTYSKFTDNCWIEELQTQRPFLLVGPLAQFLGSNKRRVLSPCITVKEYYIFTWINATLQIGWVIIEADLTDEVDWLTVNWSSLFDWLKFDLLKKTGWSWFGCRLQMSPTIIIWLNTTCLLVYYLGINFLIAEYAEIWIACDFVRI